MRAPARSGALSLIYGPMSSLLSGCSILRGAPRRKVERLATFVVPAIDVGPELDPRPVPEGGVVEQPHRDFVRQLDEAFVALLPSPSGTRRACLPAAASAVANWSAFSTRTQPWLRWRSGKREQRLGRRVVEVDRFVVLHVELDQAERILRARTAGRTGRPSSTKSLAREPSLASCRQLLLGDRLGHRPGRVGDQPEERRLELRRRLVGLAATTLRWSTCCPSRQ